MANTLVHRGPDDSGTWVDEEVGIAFGHRRLSIIDVSQAGHQPMISADGRYVIIYNGEVYNYKEIAKNINHIKWKTNSDTEVILEAFSKWGVEFVHKLNGMFAFAIYNSDTKRIFLFLGLEF